jgi:rubrerythrin
MADRDKVIRAVETCFDSWIDKHRNMGLVLDEVERMKRDALELLKEHEPVEPRKILPCITRPVGGYVCGYCGIRFLEKNDYYCPNCGRKVKWDD